MPFVTADPEALTVAAGALQGLGTAMAAQNAAAAAPTTGVVPAAADEVSALQAAQFAAYGQLYQQISAQATAIQDLFVHTLRTSADSYTETEAANTAAAAPVGAGVAGSAIAGGGLGATGLSSVAADPTFGLGGILSNAGILAAMQGANFGSAASEFTGLGKGYISEPAGVISAGENQLEANLVGQVSPAAAVAPAGAGQTAPVSAPAAPSNWAGGPATAAAAAPASTPAGAGWSATTAHTTPAGAIPAGIPAIAAAERGGPRFGTPRYGAKPKVMPRRTGV